MEMLVVQLGVWSELVSRRFSLILGIIQGKTEGYAFIWID
jgi:hypothetical protein